MITRPLGRRVDWVGSSLQDLKSFPDDVQQEFGFALYRVQLGEVPPSAKSLKGALSGVYELRERHEGNAYRVGLFGKVKNSNLRTALFSEKIEPGHRNTG